MIYYKNIEDVMDLFTIEALPLSSFINDQKLKLPRYQRKDTWKDNQSFELCMSVFQGYPVGVCIINRFPTVSWLLDGRQRRTALLKMYNDPTSIYEWAKKYCKFSYKDSETAVRDKFWAHVNDYFDAERDLSESEKKEDHNDAIEDDSDNIPILTNQQGDNTSLEKLLNLILMVHQKNNSKYEAFRCL